MPRTRSRETAAHRLDRTLAAIGDQLREVAAAEGRIRELAERAARIARGTGDVSQEAARAVLLADLSGRVENALRASGPAGTAKLARSLSAPAARVSEVLRGFRRDGSVVNIGTETEPLWAWRIGDETPTEDLMQAVDLLLRTRLGTQSENPHGHEAQALPGALERVACPGCFASTAPPRYV